MKINNTTINRAIHSAMGFECWHGEWEFGWFREFDRCVLCNERRGYHPAKLPDYTVPGQPLEDAKAWAVNQFGAVKFGKAVLDFVCVRRDDVPFSSDYDWVADFVTLPAIDMANIIVGLINEGEEE